MTGRVIRMALACCAANCAVLAVSPLTARVEEKNLLSGKTTLDPDKGYIYLVAPERLAGLFLRVPDAEDLEEYRADRAEALKKAQERYPRDLERWKYRVEQARLREREAPEKPEEPTEETFAFGDIERRLFVNFGPLFVFSKDKDSGSLAYLTPVKPGRYIWYGPVMFDANSGYTGVCYCMGSVQFDVPAGQVTDLGNFLYAAPHHAAQEVAPFIQGTASRGLTGHRTELLGDGSEPVFGLPDSLSELPSAKAEFHASGKMNNFYGVMVSRLAPIDGILSYRRDTVIDERTGQELVSEAVD